MKLKKYIEELKRRNVIKAAIAYLVIAWLFLQVFSILLPLFDAPKWVLKTITLIMAAGFPVWVLISWLYNVTPDGITRFSEAEKDPSNSMRTGKRLNRLIISFLVITIAFLIVKQNWSTVTSVKRDSTQNDNSEPLSSNLKALDFYLKGEFYHKKQTLPDINRAIENYKKAVQTDSLFAKAYSRLASAYMRKNLTFDLNQKWEEEAYSAAGKALQLDSELANPYIIKGQFFWSRSHNFAHEEAIDAFKKAISKDPKSAKAYEQLSLVQFHIGLFEEALKNAQMSIELDPGNYRARRFIGETLMFDGKYEQSLKEFNKIPDYFAPQLTKTLLALNYFYLNKDDEAIDILNKNLRENSNDPLSNSAYAIILAGQAKTAEAEQKMEIALKNSKDLLHVHHIYFQLGVASAVLGKKEMAVIWLSKAAEAGFPNYPLFNSDPYLVNLKGYPEYEALLMKLKERWEYFKSL